MAKLSFRWWLPLLMGPPLASCEKGGPGGGTQCNEVDRQTLSDIDEANWPDGLSAVVDAYLEAGGSWSVTVSCDDSPESSGEATIALEQCATSEMQLVTFEGDACDEVTQAVTCTSGGISFSDWPSFEFDGGASLGMDDFKGQWTHWSVGADTESGVLTVEWSSDGDLTGLVEPADGAFNCSLESFERP